MRIKQINARRQPGYFPYYKVQYWLHRERAWRDIQRRFPTETEAVAAAPGLIPEGVRYRLMCVTPTGRAPVSPNPVH
jgi:hypothetical protein